MKDPREMTQEEAIAEIERLRAAAPLAASQEEAMKRHASIISDALKTSGLFPVPPDEDSDDDDAGAAERQYAIQQIHAEASKVSKDWIERCIAGDDERMEMQRQSLAEYRRNNEIMERIANALQALVRH